MSLRRCLGATAGVAALWLGAILTAGGPSALGRVLLGVGHVAGPALMAVAVGWIISTIMPPGTAAGPLILFVAGLVIVAIQQGWLRSTYLWPTTGIVISVGGVLLMARSPSSSGSPSAPERMRRIVGFFVRRRLTIVPDEVAPVHVRVIAVANRTEIDLRNAVAPRFGGVVELILTTVFSMTHITVPSHWAVVIGRVPAARGVRLEGQLDSELSFDDPAFGTVVQTGESQLEALSLLVEQRRPPDGLSGRGAAVVIHLLGLGGSVTLKRSS